MIITPIVYCITQHVLTNEYSLSANTLPECNNSIDIMMIMDYQSL